MCNVCCVCAFYFHWPRRFFKVELSRAQTRKLKTAFTLKPERCLPAFTFLYLFIAIAILVAELEAEINLCICGMWLLVVKYYELILHLVYNLNKPAFSNRPPTNFSLSVSF